MEGDNKPAVYLSKELRVRAENLRVKTCEGWGNMSNIIPRSRCKCQLAFFLNPNQKVIIAIGAMQRGKKKRLLCGERAQ